MSSQLAIWRAKDEHGRRRRGTWSGTYSGKRFYCIDPRADEVCYDDTVVGVAREYRYGNQTRDVYSVLVHEMLVSEFVEKIALERGWPLHLAIDAAREDLVHDHGEAYTLDLPAPFKKHWSMWGYRRMTNRVQSAVFQHFGVYPTKQTTALVHEVDVRLRVDEVEQLMIDPELYGEKHGGIEGLGAEIPDMTVEQSSDAFGLRFQKIFPEYLAVGSLLRPVCMTRAVH